MQFPAISQLNISTPVTTNVLIGLFLVIFIIWLIHMFIVTYHWRNYGNNKLKIFRMQLIYFIGSAALFAVLVLCIAYYSVSGNYIW